MHLSLKFTLFGFRFDIEKDVRLPWPFEMDDVNAVVWDEVANNGLVPRDTPPAGEAEAAAAVAEAVADARRRR